MQFSKKYNKTINIRRIIMLIVLALLYCSMGTYIVYIWLTHNKNIKETKKVLLDTKSKTEEVVKDKIEDASKTANKTVKEVTQKTKNILNLDDEARKKAEAIAEAEAARAERLSDLRRRKDQLDLEISSADSRHRAATRTVPVIPAFDLNDSEATRQAAAAQRALRERLRKEADDAARDLRRLNIERQQVLHKIRELEK